MKNKTTRKTFDPHAGSGALLISAAMMTELTMRTADAAAQSGEAELADAFWLVAVLVADR